MASYNDTDFDTTTSCRVEVFSSPPQTFTTSVAITNYSDPPTSPGSDQFKKFREMLWLRRAQKEFDAQDLHSPLSFFE